MEDHRRVRHILSVLPAVLLVIGVCASIAAAGWTDTIAFNGDLRYRYDTATKEHKTTQARNLLRFRLMMTAQVNDQVDLAMQLGTGGPDPRAGNFGMGDSMTHKSIWLDLAYANYHPVKELSITGGKIRNPFFSPGKDELCWDSDLNPEGVGLKYAPKFGDLTLMANLGSLWIVERKEDADTMLYGGQLGLNYAFAKESQFIIGGSIFNYTNIKGYPTFYDPASNFGNSVDSAKNYAFGYSETEGFLDFTTPIATLPFELYGDYVVNSKPDDNKAGYLAGVVLGKCKNPYSWDLRYYYRRCEKDAVIGAFTSSDFAGGVTDSKGHYFGADFQLAKGIMLTTSYYLDKIGLTGASTNYNRFQFDFNFKF